MRAVLKRIQYEVVFAIVVLIAIPLFLVMTYWNVTIDIFKKTPSELEKIIRSYVYGD